MTETLLEVYLPQGTVICKLYDIIDPGAKGFLYGAGADVLDIFVVRQGLRVRAYFNSCPHIGTPLETLPDKFLSTDKSRIVCSTHGASFRLEDGVCVSGPCVGKSLTPIGVDVVDGQIVVC